MIAGKDQFTFARLFAVVIFIIIFMDEVLKEIENAITRPDLFPEIGGGEAVPGVGVARAVFSAAIEGNETRGCAFEFGGEINNIGVNGEVGETAAEGKEWFARITVLPILADGVLHGLTRERIFEFNGEDG